MSSSTGYFFIWCFRQKKCSLKGVMEMDLYGIRWVCTLVAAFLAGKLITRLRMPSILGWLITGMLLGPNALGLMPQQIMDSQWYKLIITWMQCAFGLMLGTELIWKRKNLCHCILTVCHSFLVHCSSPLSGFCFWRNCSGNGSCPGSFHCAGISHPGSGNGYLTAYGCTG